MPTWLPSFKLAMPNQSEPSRIYEYYRKSFPAPIRVTNWGMSDKGCRNLIAIVMFSRPWMRSRTCLIVYSPKLYLMGVRGDEIQWNPYVYSFLVFLPDEIFLFIDDPHFWHVSSLQNIPNMRQLCHLPLGRFDDDSHTDRFMSFFSAMRHPSNDGGLTRGAQLRLCMHLVEGVCSFVTASFKR